MSIISITWNICNREIEIGLESSIERIISINPNVNMGQFVEWTNKDTPRSWQKNRFSKTLNKSSSDKTCVKLGLSNWIFRLTAQKLCLCPDWVSFQFVKTTMSVLFWKKLEFQPPKVKRMKK